MKMRQYFFILLFLVNAVTAHGFEIGAEFSADAMQVAPGRAPMYSKMYISKHAVRTDLQRQGQQVIDIVYPDQGKRVMMFPATKTYRQQTGMPIKSAMKVNYKKTPCEGLKNIRCKKLANEILQGIRVEKWQLEHNVNGQSFKTLQWIDLDRQIPLKEMYADGTIAELHVVGKEKLENRQVERWQFVVMQPDGKREISGQLYDPELKMVVREERAGGYLRGFKNIVVGPQDKKLFEIPAGYQMIKEKNK